MRYQTSDSKHTIILDMQIYFCQLLKHAATEMNEIESVLMTAENGPGQLFKAVGDITKHSDISRISQMNCSKSFKQFASETKRI